jgi:hypothetical protein
MRNIHNPIELALEVLIIPCMLAVAWLSLTSNQ